MKRGLIAAAVVAVVAMNSLAWAAKAPEAVQVDVKELLNARCRDDGHAGEGE